MNWDKNRSGVRISKKKEEEEMEQGERERVSIET